MEPATSGGETPVKSTYAINRNGLNEIAAVLLQHAAHPVTDEAVNAYADEAERHMNEDGDGRFEIAALHARNGAAIPFSLSADCFDAVPLDE